MSEVPKQKQHPIPLRLKAPLKSKSASLPTRLDSGGAGNAVKGQDERQKQAPLTAFPARCLRALFLHLTQAVVVIHGMTQGRGHFQKFRSLGFRVGMTG